MTASVWGQDAFTQWCVGETFCFVLFFLFFFKTNLQRNMLHGFGREILFFIYLG